MKKETKMEKAQGEKEKKDTKVTIKLERAEGLPEHIRKQLGIESGLVIKRIQSNSPAQLPERIAAKNDSYIVELNSKLSKIETSKVIEALNKQINL